MVDRTFGDYFFIMFIYFFIGMIIVAAIYVIVGIFLNKLNKLIYGKGTPMAFIPIANIYLLGKLAINKIVGWLLIICLILTGDISVTVNNEKSTTSILPDDIQVIVSLIYSVATLVLFIYAIIKYFNLKKEKQLNSDSSELTNNSDTKEE